MGEEENKGGNGRGEDDKLAVEEEENKGGSGRERKQRRQSERKKIKKEVEEEEKKGGSGRGKTISRQWKGEKEAAESQLYGVNRRRKIREGGKRRRGCELCSQCGKASLLVSKRPVS